MRADLVAGLTILAVSSALLVFGGFLPLSALTSNRMGILWPLVILSVLVLLSWALVLLSLRKKGLSEEPPQSSAARRKIVFRIAAIASYIPLLSIFGFYLSAFVFSLVLPPLLGKAKWRVSAGFAIVFTLALWGLFGILMRQTLPVGYLWAAFLPADW